MFREDVVAPALALVVIVGMWWAGSRVVAEFWKTPDTVAAPRSEPPPPTTPRPAGADPTQHTSAPVAPTGESRPGQLDSATPAARSSEPLASEAISAPAEHAASTDVTATGTAGATDATDAVVSPDDVDRLRAKRLRVPVDGIDRATLMSNFHQARGGGSHEAMDIMAARGTPILAVEDGRVAKLFTSKKGGLTIYQFDPSGSFCYYYAHLDRYSHALDEGKMVTAGEVIGYVGSSGNASPDAPHLHFAVFKLGPDRRWWQGLPIDPYLVLR